MLGVGFIMLDKLVCCVGNKPNSQPVRNKKNRENTRQRKQSHAQDNFYVVRQFAYIYGVIGISLLSGKNTKCSYSVFSLPLKTTQHYSSQVESSIGLNIN